MTVLFAASASRLVVDAGFNKMVPLKHEYMKVYREYEKVFGSANRVAIAVVQKDGDIYNQEFMAKLKALTNDVFLLNGVDRPVGEVAVHAQHALHRGDRGGLRGRQRDPGDLPGHRRGPGHGARQREQVRTRSGAPWRPTSPGALVSAGLLEIDPQTGSGLNYFDGAAKLEALRAKYESDRHSLHIIGFAKAWATSATARAAWSPSSAWRSRSRWC
jgi:hypothetical protein